MTPSHAVKNGKRYRYYVSQPLLRNRGSRAGSGTRIPAHEIEAVVIREIRALLHHPTTLLDALANKAPDLAELQALLAAASDLALRWPSLAPAEIKAVVRAIVGRVVVRAEQVDIVLSSACLRAALRPGVPPHLGEPDHREVTRTVDACLQRCGGETKLIVRAGRQSPRARTQL